MAGKDKYQKAKIDYHEDVFSSKSYLVGLVLMIIGIGLNVTVVGISLGEIFIIVGLWVMGYSFYKSRKRKKYLDEKYKFKGKFNRSSTFTAVGLVLMIIGGLLSLTIIGVIIGLPLIIIGFIIALVGKSK